MRGLAAGLRIAVRRPHPRSLRSLDLSPRGGERSAFFQEKIRNDRSAHRRRHQISRSDRTVEGAAARHGAGLGADQSRRRHVVRHRCAPLDGPSQRRRPRSAVHRTGHGALHARPRNLRHHRGNPRAGHRHSQSAAEARRPHRFVLFALRPLLLLPRHPADHAVSRQHQFRPLPSQPDDGRLRRVSLLPARRHAHSRAGDGGAGTRRIGGMRAADHDAQLRAARRHREPRDRC